MRQWFSAILLGVFCACYIVLVVWSVDMMQERNRAYHETKSK